MLFLAKNRFHKKEIIAQIVTKLLKKLDKGKKMFYNVSVLNDKHIAFMCFFKAFYISLNRSHCFYIFYYSLRSCLKKIRLHKFLCVNLYFVKAKKLEVIFMNMMHKPLSKFASPRKVLSTVMLVLMVFSTCFTLTAATLRDFTVLDGEKVLKFKTGKNTVGEAIAEANLNLSEYDIVNVPLETPVDQASPVMIKRAEDVFVKDGAKEIYSVKTAYENAKDILKQHNIFVDENDIVVFTEKRLTITRVEFKTETVSNEIPFETIYEDDSSLYIGETKTAVEGVNGLENIVYRDLYHNGEFVERNIASQEVVVEPVNKVVKKGTKQRPIPAPRNTSVTPPTSYVNMITCRATAYDGSYETLGKTNPRTALGRVPTVGTVAVDPRVIPLGTKLYITSSDGSYVYGYGFAGDTGGAIKGNRVDLFMGSRAEALSFGSRSVNVYIL